MITFYDILLVAAVGVGLPVWSWTSRRWYTEGAAGRITRYWVVAFRGAVLSLLAIVAWRYAGRPLSRLGLDVPVGPRGRAGFVVDALIAAYYVGVQLRSRSPEHMAAVRLRLQRAGSYNMLPRTRAEFRVYPIAAIVGSAFEELVYRGYLIGGLAPIAGAPIAVVLSSALFGAGHLYQGAAGVARTAVIGLVFGLAFVVTGSLWWLMIAHASINLAGLLLAKRLAAASTDPLGNFLPR